MFKRMEDDALVRAIQTYEDRAREAAERLASRLRDRADLIAANAADSGRVLREMSGLLANLNLDGIAADYANTEVLKATLRERRG